MLRVTVTQSQSFSFCSRFLLVFDTASLDIGFLINLIYHLSSPSIILTTHRFSASRLSLVFDKPQYWISDQSCFRANTVQSNSLLYPLGVSHNITESVKPFLIMKHRQINARKQLSLQKRSGEQNFESNLKIARRVWVLQLQE